MRVLEALRRPSEPGPGILATMVLVNSFGTGLYLAAGAIYLTRSAHISASGVGLGLSLGGGLGLVGGVVLGDQADRRDARSVVIGTLILEAAATTALIAVHSVLALTAVAGLLAVGRSGSSSGRGALIALAAAPGQGAKLRTYLRAVSIWASRAARSPLRLS